MKLVLSQKKYIMPLMHDVKFRNESEKMKDRKGKKKKRRKKSHGYPEVRIMQIVVSFIGKKGGKISFHK